MKKVIVFVVGVVVGLLLPHLLDPHHWHELLGEKAHAAPSPIRQGTMGHDWGSHKGFENQQPLCAQSHTCAKTLRGDDAANTVYGKRGMDWGAFNGGNDVVYGNSGMDQLYGSCGDDKLYGQEGHDHLYGDGQECKTSRGGNDALVTADGVDEIHHIETIDPGLGIDLCTMDEDLDGIAISPDICEVLRLKDVPGVTGDTPLIRFKEARRGSRAPYDTLPGPGRYTDVGN